MQRETIKIEDDTRRDIIKSREEYSDTNERDNMDDSEDMVT